jgi:hypothetical protein
MIIFIYLEIIQTRKPLCSVFLTTRVSDGEGHHHSPSSLVPGPSRFQGGIDRGGIDYI